VQLIIDSNFLCYRAKHSIPTLSFKGFETHIIFSFLNQIITLADKFETSRVIFCWDSRQSFRKILYPDYKAKRKESRDKRLPEEVQFDNLCYEQYEILRRIVLPELGFKNVHRVTGLESDDLIAFLAKTATEETVIVSSDGDLYQLLDDKVSMYNPTKKKMITAKTFENEWGITPPLWGEVKALAGCSTDNVEGVKGVGEKTAIRYLKGELKEGVVLKRIKESGDIINRNASLVILPYKDIIEVLVPSYREEVLYKEVFVNTFSAFGFQHFTTPPKWNKWVDVFNLKKKRRRIK